MADIFISYASGDRDRVIPIVKALEEQGWFTWWDWTSIPVGKTWRQFIQEGLGEAKCVMVLWSAKSINSEWVLEEADHGKINRKLVPARIDDVRPPIGFGQIQAANLIKWTGDTNHPEFNKLTDALEVILGPSPRHVRESEQAAEEERNRKHEKERKRIEEEQRRDEEELQRLKKEKDRIAEDKRRLERSSMTMPKVFICYRREDSAYPAHHIYAVLKNHYGADSVVFDVDTIPLGADFREYLSNQVSRCDVLYTAS